MASFKIKIKDFLDIDKLIQEYNATDFSFTVNEDNEQIPSFYIPNDFISKIEMSDEYEFVGLYSKPDAKGELIAFQQSPNDTELKYTDFAIQKLSEYIEDPNFSSISFYATYGIRDVPDLNSEIEALPGIRAVQIGPYDFEDEYGNILRQKKYYKIIGSNHFDEVYTGKLYITGENENILFEMGNNCLIISFVQEELDIE